MVIDKDPGTKKLPYLVGLLAIVPLVGFTIYCCAFACLMVIVGGLMGNLTIKEKA